MVSSKKNSKNKKNETNFLKHLKVIMDLSEDLGKNFVRVIVTIIHNRIFDILNEISHMLANKCDAKFSIGNFIVYSKVIGNLRKLRFDECKFPQQCCCCCKNYSRCSRVGKYFIVCEKNGKIMGYRVCGFHSDASERNVDENELVKLKLGVNLYYIAHGYTEKDFRPLVITARKRRFKKSVTKNTKNWVDNISNPVKISTEKKTEIKEKTKVKKSIEHLSNDVIEKLINKLIMYDD